MPLSQLPDLLSAWFTDIAAALDRRSAPRLLLLLVGALFAKGRRTVTSWFRAAETRVRLKIWPNRPTYRSPSFTLTGMVGRASPCPGFISSL
jgi:hypothetical protein